MAAQCEEGGQHDYTVAQSTGCCGWTWRILCCPCWLLCYAGSKGVQGLGKLSRDVAQRAEDGNGEIVCFKCGLTPSEAEALAEGRARAEGMRHSQSPSYRSAERMNYHPTSPSHLSPSPSFPPPPQPRNRSPSATSYHAPPPADATYEEEATSRPRAISNVGNPAVEWVEQQRRAATEGR